MKIGIDLRALQTGHKYRGIGEVAKQVTNRIIKLAEADKKHQVNFIFYEYDDDNPKEILDIPKGFTYEVVKLGKSPENAQTVRTRKDKLRQSLRQLYGEPIGESHKSDIYLQFDYMFGVPRDAKTYLIKHDLIPLVFWNKYFDSVGRHIKNRALRTSIRTAYANYKYKHVLKRGVKNAHKIIAVSESTKSDLKALLGVRSGKVEVVHLGVDIEPSKTAHDTKVSNRMPTKPYLLFIGAGDARRRVDDLVAAYNVLKSEGHDIQLVLVGENFLAPEKIPNKVTRDAVMSSSYQDDILTLGYVDDMTKQDLFKKATAYVYPTLYEGFGIPILEAMLVGCPVIVYKNSATAEVGGDAAIYAKDWQEIVTKAQELLEESSKDRSKRVEGLQAHAKQFTWDNTAQEIYKILVHS